MTHWLRLIIYWTVRVVSGLLVLFVLAIIIGEAEGGLPDNWRDGLLLGAIVIQAAGLAIACRWAVAGLVVTIGGIALLAVVDDRWPEGPVLVFPLLALLLFLTRDELRHHRPVAHTPQTGMQQ